MSSLHDRIRHHYVRSNLVGRIEGALRDCGISDSGGVSRDEIANLEEFHIRGRDSTRDLARMARVKPGDHILDLGAGIGGPARALVDEYGCAVVGLELVDEYCRVAEMLSRAVGMEGAVPFVRGDASILPFAGHVFDCVMSQHTIMNIPDKERMCLEAARVLRPGGELAIHEAFAGNGELIDYPVPWAEGPQMSFMVSHDHFSTVARDSGFVREAYVDVSDISVEWMEAAMKARGSGERRGPGLGLLMGSDAHVKSRNLLGNLKRGSIRIVMGIYRTSF